MTVVHMFARRPVEAGRLVTSADVAPEPPPGAVRSALALARDWLRVGGLVVAAASLGAMALCAAGVSAVAARASKRVGAPSSAPMSTRQERELRKAIRRSFIATGLTELDLMNLRDDVRVAARAIRVLRSRHPASTWPARREIERKLSVWRDIARRAELRYAAACAAAGAVPSIGGR